MNPEIIDSKEGFEVLVVVRSISDYISYKVRAIN